MFAEEVTKTHIFLHSAKSSLCLLDVRNILYTYLFILIAATKNLPFSSFWYFIKSFATFIVLRFPFYVSLNKGHHKQTSVFPEAITHLESDSDQIVFSVQNLMIAATFA